METATDMVLIQNSRDLKLQPVDDGAMLVDMRSGVCFELNKTGLEVWNLLASGATIQTVCAALMARYNVAADTIAADVNAIVDALKRQNLVRPVLPGEERP